MWIVVLSTVDFFEGCPPTCDLKVLKVFTTQTEAHEWVRLGGFEDTSDESCGKYYKILEL